MPDERGRSSIGLGKIFTFMFATEIDIQDVCSVKLKQRKIKKSGEVRVLECITRVCEDQLFAG